MLGSFIKGLSVKSQHPKPWQTLNLKAQLAEEPIQPTDCRVLVSVSPMKDYIVDLSGTAVAVVIAGPCKGSAVFSFVDSRQLVNG